MKATKYKVGKLNEEVSYRERKAGITASEKYWRASAGTEVVGIYDDEEEARKAYESIVLLDRELSGACGTYYAVDGKYIEEVFGDLDEETGEFEERDYGKYNEAWADE